MRGAIGVGAACVLGAVFVLSSCAQRPEDEDSSRAPEAVETPITASSPPQAEATPTPSPTTVSATATPTGHTAPSLADIDMATVPYVATLAGEREDPTAALTLAEAWQIGTAAQECMHEAGYEWELEVASLGSSAGYGLADWGRPVENATSWLRVPLTSYWRNDERYLAQNEQVHLDALSVYYGDGVMMESSWAIVIPGEGRVTGATDTAIAVGPGGCFGEAHAEYEFEYASEPVVDALVDAVQDVRSSPGLADARDEFAQCTRDQGVTDPIDVSSDYLFETLEMTEGGFDALEVCMPALAQAEDDERERLQREVLAEHTAELALASEQAIGRLEQFAENQEFQEFLDELELQFREDGQ